MIRVIQHGTVAPKHGRGWIETSVRCRDSEVRRRRPRRIETLPPAALSATFTRRLLQHEVWIENELAERDGCPLLVADLLDCAAAVDPVWDR